MVNSNSSFPESYVPNSIFEMKVKNCLIELKKRGVSGDPSTQLVVDGKSLHVDDGKIELGNSVLRDVGTEPNDLVEVEENGKISKCLLPEISAGVGNIFIYSGDTECMEDVISWAKSMKSSPVEGDVLVVNTDSCIRGNYLAGGNKLETSDDLVELVTPMDLVSSVKVHDKVYRPTNGMIDLSGLDKVKDKIPEVIEIHNPELTPEEGVCTWEVCHNIGRKHVMVQVFDNLTGNIIYPLVNLVDENSLKVTLKSATNVPKEYYTVVIR